LSTLNKSNHFFPTDDYDFSTGDAGASHSYASEAGQIRVGG